VKSGINTADRDTGVRPQDDLFGYVNGDWIRRTEIPDDRPLHGSIVQVRDDAEEHVRAIVEEAAASQAPAGTAACKVGDLFASFMAADRVDALASAPISEELEDVRTVEDSSALLALAGRLHRTGVGDAIGLCVDTDARNSSRYLVHLNQSGLGLPDESYYRDESFADIRASYVAHLARMLELSWYAASAAVATDAAGRIIALETRLAAGHWDVVRSRDAVATYTLVDRGELEAQAPQADWAAWLSGLGAPGIAFEEVVVRQLSYLGTWSQALSELPLADWKDWLAWQVVTSRSPYLISQQGKDAPVIDGMTGAQRFFEGWAQCWKAKTRDAEAIRRLSVDPHAPPEFRANVVRNLEEFYSAYGVAEGDGLWLDPKDRVRIW